MLIEAQCINYILTHGIDGFKSDYFVEMSPQFEFLFNWVEKYGKVPDKITFLDKFNDFKLFEVKEPREALLDRLKEEALAQKIIPAYNKCGELIENGDSISAVNYLLEEIDRVKKQLMKKAASVDITDYDYKVSEYRRLKEGLTLMSTGFKELDDLFGGWSNEDLVVLFARLGVGKSWVAIRFAYELVKQGRRVGFYAGEMSASKLSLRMDSFNTGVSNFSLLMGKVDENSYSSIAKQMADLPGKMLVLTPKELGDSATVEDIKDFIESDRLDCVFIDQISLLKMSGRKSVFEATGEIANKLRILQSVTGIPIFIISQQNRASLHDEAVGAEHIANSDNIGQNATIAISLEYDKDTKILTQNIVKSRNSSTAKFSYLWDIDKGTMKYIPHEDSVVDTSDSTDYCDLPGEIF